VWRYAGVAIRRCGDTQVWRYAGVAMGRRRGNTGAGGAVVSSLSENAGGTLRKKSGKDGKAASKENDLRVDMVFDSPAARRKPRHADAVANSTRAGSAGAGSSTSIAYSAGGVAVPESVPGQYEGPKSAGWIGKTPVIMLRDWCAKNDRKMAMYA
jgi:hypothetical protein